ncbi:hypothetical protein [Streptomyces sp. TRM75563]|uniref:hypothetical protein n=1 Tax=Streptomyces sp. TRM75563 TaxID=2817418 RepID=UPI001F6106E1|nr:hypothetical protein [Streptomyces sp. TRM75563]MCI4042332.1 hypothetical protein [Streptomyces sp. TRM75563]
MLGLLALVALLGAFSFGLGFVVMIGAMVAVWVLPPWRRFAKIGATFGAFLLLTVGAGLGGQLDENGREQPDVKAREDSKASAEATASSTPAQIVKAADCTGTPLNDAEKLARFAGFTTGDHDAAKEDRSIIMRSGWTVCFQEADAAAKTIDFAAVKSYEPCAEKDGGALPWPRTPNVVGATYNTAAKDLKQADDHTRRLYEADIQPMVSVVVSGRIALPQSCEPLPLIDPTPSRAHRFFSPLPARSLLDRLGSYTPRASHRLRTRQIPVGRTSARHHAPIRASPRKPERSPSAFPRLAVSNGTGIWTADPKQGETRA